MKIDLGCGGNIKEGFYGVDFETHNLNIFPYPWDSNSVDEVYMSHILEHLNNPVEVMREVYRIIKPNGLVTVKVPHVSGRCAWNNIEHNNVFNLDWCDSLVSGEGTTIKPLPFIVVSKCLHWSCSNYRIGHGRRFIDFLIDYLVNLNVRIFERLFIYWVGGVEEIEWVFKK